MKACVISEVGKVEVVDVPKPTAKANELIIKVKACALCTHEQRVFRGVTHPKLPYLAGHEISGIVESWGKEVVGNWKKGDRVVVRTLYSCMSCDPCRSGHNNFCVNSDGGIDTRTAGLGEYIAIPEFQVFHLPDNVSFYQGALTEPLACAIHSVKLVNIDFGDVVVVIGAGIMGCFQIQLSRLRGAKVIAIEPDKKRRQKAIEVGASATIDPSSCSQSEELKRLTGGEGAEVVINTVADPKAIVSSIELVKKSGSLVLYSGLYPNYPVEVDLGQIHKKEIKLLGSFSTDSKDFIQSIKLQKMNVVEVEPFINEIVPLSNAQKAFDDSLGAYRIVIDMDK